jgi:hypothetical protein
MRRVWIGCLVACALLVASALLLIGRDAEVSPDLTVSVVDEQGRPMPAVEVSRCWRQYSFETEEHSETAISDVRGEAHFPPAKVRVSTARYVLYPLLNSLRLQHASFGPYVHVLAEDPRSRTFGSIAFETHIPRSARLIMTRSGYETLNNDVGSQSPSIP